MMEQALREGLARVPAPAELWDRVEMPRVEVRPESRSARPWTFGWAAAAVILAVVFAGNWPSRELQSSDSGEIRAWVRKNAGVDLPAFAPSAPRLVRATKLGGNRVEIAFLAGSETATMLVEPAGGGSPVHGVPGAGVRTASWVWKGQRFTLECPSPEALTAACRLCHG